MSSRSIFFARNYLLHGVGVEIFFVEGFTFFAYIYGLTIMGTVGKVIATLFSLSTWHAWTLYK